MTENEDPGYCGLEPYETGKNDPYWRIACEPHDKAFRELKAGTYQGSGIGPNAKFASAVVTGAAKGALLIPFGLLTLRPRKAIEGAILVAASVPYLFLGAGYGLFRWGQIERRMKREKPFLGPK